QLGSKCGLHSNVKLLSDSIGCLSNELLVIIHWSLVHNRRLCFVTYSRRCPNGTTRASYQHRPLPGLLGN
ncbi:hypothetical protein, partial [Moorena sp. SIO3I8]|uniref:hypothetical protein n=1 Tax=Moorena sp. SIO3I8 TaxID=2607833 RepID=UPI0025EBAD5A